MSFLLIDENEDTGYGVALVGRRRDWCILQTRRRPDGTHQKRLIATAARYDEALLALEDAHVRLMPGAHSLEGITHERRRIRHKLGLDADAEALRAELLDKMQRMFLFQGQCFFDEIAAVRKDVSDLRKLQLLQTRVNELEREKARLAFGLDPCGLDALLNILDEQPTKEAAQDNA